jgi:hypothetical protein
VGGHGSTDDVAERMRQEAPAQSWGTFQAERLARAAVDEEFRAQHAIDPADVQAYLDGGQA